MTQISRLQGPHQPPRATNRTSGRHRSSRLTGQSTFARNFLLETRRAKRICRPFLPVLARALIVIFTAIELRPITAHLDGYFTPFISRIGVLAGFMASIMSVIFFDLRIFNFVVIAAIFLKFLLDVYSHEFRNIHQIVASLCFHSTAILFSTLVGRRRSISKPSALRSTISTNGYYMESLRGLRNIDVLEAGTRLQASLLALDYSLSRKVGSTAFFFTLPFAVLFLFGYCTQRNGTILLILLFCFSVMNESSPVLGFNFTKTISTVSGAMLGIFVGPGLLTVDEWLATAKQLCY